ncbi:MAG: DUF1015 family protein [Flavobacteriaceae bacterium]|nr:DUF1015 family protein [Flavobacteriaceae bacterium]
MPRIYPQTFYLTDQLVKNSSLFSEALKSSNPFQSPVSLNVTNNDHFQRFSKHLYQLNNPGLLLYEFESNNKKYHGLLCCLQTTDFQNGNITKHEKIDHKKVLDIEKQYHNTSIKAEPIIVAFENDENIKNLISNIIDTHSDFSTSIDGQQHQFWLIDHKTSQTLQNCFHKIDYFHLVDGHHRTNAIENLKKQTSKSNHIFCFLIELEQIELKSFIWNIHTALTEFECNKIERILKAFHSQKTQNLDPPSHLFPLMVYWKNSCYKFHKQSINDSIIPRFIEEEFYHAIPSSSHWKKEYIPYLGDDNLETKTFNHSVSFLMQSLTKAQLIEMAIKNDLLPQKSTYALPKLTQNLVLSPF